jgi:DNA modification methylase
MGQYFKSIYFSDYPSEDSKEKSITLAFNEPEAPYYTKIKELSSEELRELIGIKSYKQLSLFAEKEERSINQVAKRLIKKNLNELSIINPNDVTFVNSKSIPFQRWYPFIEGYSPDFVKSLINSYCKKAACIYDPFVGTGTTIFAADRLNIKTVYSEINPLLQFLIQTKIRILKSSLATRKQLADKINQVAEQAIEKAENFEEDKYLKESYSLIFGDSKYFEGSILSQLLCLRSFIDIVKLEDDLLADTITIAVLAALIPVSFLKKAGDVRFKNESELEKEKVELENFLPNKLKEIANDILNLEFILKTTPELILSNAKNIDLVNDLKIDAVITSPPYLNGTNYFRNTKLELWFLRYIQFENDLRFFRDQALTSGINDVKKDTSGSNGTDILAKSKLLQDTLVKLHKKSYDQRIPLMVKSYFEEMYAVFSKLREHLPNRAQVLIDIGDSIFANVHIKTDDILVEILAVLGYELKEKKLLRKRRSRNKEILSQTLLVLEFDKSTYKSEKNLSRYVVKRQQKIQIFNLENWEYFKNKLPHQKLPYSKRNWGHPLHSLCSYQGKLKASIAHHLVKTFVPENGSVLDPFSGVGTIPFEAALNGRKSYGFDISIPAYYISAAKVSTHKKNECLNYIHQIAEFIERNGCTKEELNESKHFGFNKTLAEYYEDKTLKEILIARRFLKLNYPKNPSQMLVVSSLLHILHGNRPYALSRRSHPIVPYAPQGEFVYKNLIKNLTDKVERALQVELPLNFIPGKIFNQDSTSIWPQEINNLDAIITSPPFFDSTRFYLANWIRIWFSGWSEKDFKYQINSYIEEKQKKDFTIYESIFRQSRERLKRGGVCVLHLGKSVKCDMAEELKKVSNRWFNIVDLFMESVEHCESHGIRDKGTVTSHQYLVLQ